MVLEYKTKKIIKAKKDFCIECLLNPENILSASKYTLKIQKIGDNLYLVEFAWEKFRMKRKFQVTLRVKKEDDIITYESIEGSKYPMKMKFKLKELDDKIVEININSSMQAGLMADFFGKRDYASFIEEILDTGLAKSLSRLTTKEPTPINIMCTNCILYDPVKKYCFYMRKPIQNPTMPPCRGKAYISDSP